MLLGAILDSYYQALEIKLNIHNFKYERAGEQHFTTGKQVLIPKAHNKDERHTHEELSDIVSRIAQDELASWPPRRSYYQLLSPVQSCQRQQSWPSGHC